MGDLSYNKNDDGICLACDSWINLVTTSAEPKILDEQFCFRCRASVARREKLLSNKIERKWREFGAALLIGMGLRVAAEELLVFGTWLRLAEARSAELWRYEEHVLYVDERIRAGRL